MMVEIVVIAVVVIGIVVMAISGHEVEVAGGGIIDWVCPRSSCGLQPETRSCRPCASQRCECLLLKKVLLKKVLLKKHQRDIRSPAPN